MFPDPVYYGTKAPKQSATTRNPDYRRKSFRRVLDAGPNGLRRCTQHGRHVLNRDQPIRRNRAFLVILTFLIHEFTPFADAIIGM